MTETTQEPTLGALLRRAGYDLPPAAVAEMEHGYSLLQVMLARIPRPLPEAEPATAFRPEVAR